MPSSNTLFPVTIFQEKIIFFGFVFLLGIVSILGATLGVTPSIFFLFALGIVFLLALLFPRPAVWAMMTLTILFERFFTLQPLILGKSVLKIYPVDMMMLGLLSAFILSWVLFRFRKNIWMNSDIWVTLFFIYVTFLFFLSVFGIAGSETAVAFSTWKQYAFYGAFFFLIRLAMDDMTDLRRIVKVLLGSVAVAGIFLCIGIIRGEGLWSEYTPLSTAGVRILAFPHALYFSLACIIAWILSTTSVISLGFRRAISVFIPFLIIGILGSLMRHLWLALVIALGCGLFLLPQKGRDMLLRGMGVYIGLGTVIMLLFLSVLSLMPGSSLSERVYSSGSILSTRITSIGDTYDESAAWRGAVWQSAFIRFAQHPLIGIGLGNSVPVELGEYRDIIEVRNIHNSWFALIVQTGIIGAALFLLFFGGVCLRVFHMETPTEGARITRVILLSLAVFFSVVFFFQPYLETNLLAFFFWMMTGIMAIVSRKDFFVRYTHSE